MTFVTEAALIALREGLEALLITGILLGLVTRLGRRDARKHVWVGFWAAVATSLLAGVLIQRYLLSAFEQRGWGAWFELIAALLAVATLTYMVFWMWSHTAQVLKAAKDKVRLALTTGSLATIVFITYISVVREGLETVLFYSALTSQAGLADILWSGLAGFALSALLVYGLLKGARTIGLKRFFTLTGAFLLVVAAMLLTHVVGALTELGYLAPQVAIWDTSHLIADDSVAGRVLHATLGYTAAPSLLQAVLYFGYLGVAGGAYAWTTGAFHRRTTGGPRVRRGRLAAATLAVLLISSLIATAAIQPTDTLAGHSHGAEAGQEDNGLPAEARVAVVLRNHGEPVHYNETTYQSFAEFTRHILEMYGYGPLLNVDQGTVLLDGAHPFQEGPRLDAELMDAWLDDHPGPAAYVGSPFPEVQQVPMVDGYYLAPGGPGLGEPDILELAGLSAYTAWIQMEGTSPMHFDKKAVLDQVRATLQERYGDQVTVHEGYSIVPFVAPDESFEATARSVAEAETTLVVDAYTSHLHSDVMDTCMMQPRMEAALRAAGYTGPVLRTGPSGTTAAFAEGAAAAVVERVNLLPEDARVALLLTHHGMTPGAQSPCMDRADPYNAMAAEMFEATRDALDERLDGREVQILQVYGQGADSQDDGVLSPQEALKQAQQWGATHVLDVPYELPGNGFDNLVVHRNGYGLDPAQAPHYDEAYETQLTRYGMSVTITSSAFAADARAAAQVHVIEHALAEAFGLEPPGEGHTH